MFPKLSVTKVELTSIVLKCSDLIPDRRIVRESESLFASFYGLIESTHATVSYSFADVTFGPRRLQLDGLE